MISFACNLWTKRFDFGIVAYWEVKHSFCEINLVEWPLE